MAHATGDDAAATLAFDRVRATDPANPCATMQPR